MQDTASQLRPVPRFVAYDKFLDCVHCGLCLSACPTYIELGTEMDSPRGRIYLMKGLEDGSLQMAPDAFEPKGVLGMSRVFIECGEIATHFEVTFVNGLQVLLGGSHLFFQDVPEIAGAQHRRMAGDPGKERLLQCL